ncbi:response regulator [uncultured Prevotella sp.]|uniref:response regulator n=1 Tax=uncultured Prevotella sp. TaxID=159272 RepID=UPI0027E39501|nr:response regulator [uncultured Prevotella sp.]
MNYPYNTIVVVDDNSAILTALKICLAMDFERIVTLSSPDTLVATLAKEENVDAVLLDMNFSLGVNSGQDGLFWLRTIKKLYPNTPVILITAYADVQLAVKGLKYGAADFVTKPWDNDKLIATLHDAIDKNREVLPLEQMEQEHVQRAVEQCHGNMSRAAEMLGITRQTLYKKLKK